MRTAGARGTCMVVGPMQHSNAICILLKSTLSSRHACRKKHARVRERSVLAFCELERVCGGSAVALRERLVRGGTDRSNTPSISAVA